MVLQQAEEEGMNTSRRAVLLQPTQTYVAGLSLLGYSVFVVKRINPTQRAGLPQTEADRQAALIPDPSSGTSSLPVNQSHTISSHAPDACRSRSLSPGPPSPRSWQEERSHSPMHQLLEAVETEQYRDTSFPPYLRGPPRRPGSDTHGGLGGFERLDPSGDDPELQAAMEDRELQAALQASLISRSVPVSANNPFFDAFQPQDDEDLESPLPIPIPPPLFQNSRSSADRASGTAGTTGRTPSSRNRRSVPGSGSTSGSGSRTNSRGGRNFVSSNSIPVSTEPEIDTDLDPVAASVARNKLIMERMRREQEMAFTDAYEDVDMEEVSRRSRETHEEEEMLKRAIEESEKLAKEVEERERQDNPDHRQTTGASSSASPPSASMSLAEEHRVYDDEDAELQAALKASLQDVPPGYQPPPPLLRYRRPIPEGLSLSRKQTLAPVMGFTDLPSVFTPNLDSGTGTPRTGLGTSMFSRRETLVEDTKGEEKEKIKEGKEGKGKETQKGGNETDSEYEVEGSVTDPEEEEVSMEEMRRRRLAKFQG